MVTGVLLGVMSDSHDNLQNLEKALKILRQRSVDMVIHLGDIVSPFTMRRLVQFPARVIVIRGNNDGDLLQLREIANKAGAVFRDSPHEVRIEDRSILLVHGYGSKEFTKRIVYSIAKSGAYDIILYGHTHEPDVTEINRCLVVNPGEVFGYLSGEASVAIVDTRTLRAEIVRL